MHLPFSMLMINASPYCIFTSFASCIMVSVEMQHLHMKQLIFCISELFSEKSLSEESLSEETLSSLEIWDCCT